MRDSSDWSMHWPHTGSAVSPCIPPHFSYMVYMTVNSCTLPTPSHTLSTPSLNDYLNCWNVPLNRHACWGLNVTTGNQIRHHFIESVVQFCVCLGRGYSRSNNNSCPETYLTTSFLSSFIPCFIILFPLFLFSMFLFLFNWSVSAFWKSSRLPKILPR